MMVFLVSWMDEGGGRARNWVELGMVGGIVALGF